MCRTLLLSTKARAHDDIIAIHMDKAIPNCFSPFSYSPLSQPLG